MPTMFNEVKVKEPFKERGNDFLKISVNKTRFVLLAQCRMVLQNPHMQMQDSVNPHSLFYIDNATSVANPRPILMRVSFTPPSPRPYL